MKITKTEFKDLLIIEPTIHKDSRGYFMESYNEQAFLNHGLETTFVQDNQSKSSHGVIRGLHFQKPPYAQAKLVRVLSGKILDVVVDIRKSSSNYGKHFVIELSAENQRQLFIPKGFAHGFSVLSTEATLFYKCDNYYHQSSEGGLRYNDPKLGIDWKIDVQPVVSEKDQNLETIHNFKSPFN